MSLVDIHGRLAITILLYTTAMGVWGLVRYFRHKGVNSNYWGGLAINEILILVQGGLGIYLWISQLRPERGSVHVLYGIVTALSIPAVYVFTKGNDERREMLIYSIILLIVVVLSFRAMITGG
jgi:hypothetical protein